ncbi:MAG TPA: MarR family transcriptional regulator [Candidatus Blautia faecavium]|uniref:MarR family transcriptional regulator n=1 Tax=Candidatus Blautia faecavium TaxID=2838487 RepID=A0A9D2LTR4_9FIRM|nr:MarR family transcriptional regulator [Candidatus Blautia faecavium]
MIEEFQTERLLLLLKKINIDMELRLEKALRKEDMSGTQAYFLVYILRHHPGGTYITELCHEIGVSKATLSTLAKKLREKGYLCFEENPKDVRKKKLVPTEKLTVQEEEFLSRAQQVEEKICQVLDLKERQQLWELEHKILIGLSEKENRQEVTA